MGKLDFDRLRVCTADKIATSAWTSPMGENINQNHIFSDLEKTRLNRGTSTWNDGIKTAFQLFVHSLGVIVQKGQEEVRLGLT